MNRYAMALLGALNLGLAGYGLYRHRQISRQEADPTFGHHNMFLIAREAYGYEAVRVGGYPKEECALCNPGSGRYPPSVAARNRAIRHQERPVQGAPGSAGPGPRFATEAERQGAVREQIRAILGLDPSLS